ncbi:MAG: hypothetical protein ACRD6U_05095 [Nitrososphaeraceae archaeon]
MIKLRQKYNIQNIRVSLLLSSLFLLLFVNLNSIYDESNLLFYHIQLFSDALSQPACNPDDELEQGKTPLSVPPTDIGIDISTELKLSLFDLKDAITGKESNIPICEDDDGMYRLSTSEPFEIKINSKILKDKVIIPSDANNQINSNDIDMKLEGKEVDGILQSLENENVCSYDPIGSKDTIICELPKNSTTTIKLNGQDIVVGKSIDDKGIIIISEMSSPNTSIADIYACGDSVSSPPTFQIIPGDIIKINC